MSKEEGGRRTESEHTDDGDCHHHEENRRDESDLAANEIELALEDRAAGSAETMLELKRERDPVVSRIPEDDGEKHQEGDERRGVGPRLSKPRT
jgi:hypothetical protein